MTNYDGVRPLAARHDFHGQYATRHWFDWVADRLALPAGARVLDVGCGPAWFWRGREFGHPPAELTLADLSPAMVDEALAHAGEIAAGAVTGLVADVGALPFRDGAFDVVIAMHMLHHAAEPASAVAELSRVLAPGGTCFVTTVAHDDLEELNALVRAVYDGAAAGDLARAAFGADLAEAGLRAAFGTVSRTDFADAYRVTSADDIFRYLSSMPPALGGGEPRLATLSQTVRAALAAGEGAVETTRRATLFSATG